MRKSGLGHSIIAALAILASTSVSAELAGPARCTNPTWSDIAAGECIVEREAVNDAVSSPPSDDSLRLMLGSVVGNVPEPGTYALMIAGLVVVGRIVRRRRRS